MYRTILILCRDFPNNRDSPCKNIVNVAPNAISCLRKTATGDIYISNCVQLMIVADKIGFGKLWC